MSVSKVEIHSRTDYCDGQAFGATGPYERFDGTIHFAVDPTHLRNRAITDLDKALRDASGRVHFSADLCVLRPLDAARGNRNLLVEVLNRGRKLVPGLVNHAPRDAAPTADIPPGDGFLLRRGWTLAWIGWQWDVIRSDALMGLEAPQALNNGQPIAGQTVCEFQPAERLSSKLLANRVHHPYPAEDLHDPRAVLSVRDWPGGERTVIPRDHWRFARDEQGEPVPDDTHIWLQGGFEPGKVYEVVYRTRVCPVVGTGLLAIRDGAAFLRHGSAADGNPCAGTIDHLFGYGMSQSGRFLRHFLHLGLNLDESDQPVFDGLSIHVAGARRGEFNHRYGQPSVQNTPNFGHLPPFADEDLPDASGAVQPGLLHQQRALGGLPKIIYTNTSAEYWRCDGYLGHIGLDPLRDLTLPAETRNYHFSSTQHGPGGVPLVDRDLNEGSRGAHGFNAVDYVPLMRAALINLERWVTEGRDPPAHCHPQLSDGTAVPPGSALAPLAAMPLSAWPSPEKLVHMPRVELGPDGERGIGDYPVGINGYLPLLVPAVDADGIELGGIRMPDLSAPIATYIGWNPRHELTGGPGQIISMNGSTIPFPRTEADRTVTQDPRPAVTERYASRAAYLEEVRAAAERLVNEGYLLEEDVAVALEIAEERLDTLVGDPWESSRSTRA